MSEIGSALGDAGGKHSIVWRGKRIYAKMFGLRQLEQYAKWLYSQQKEFLREDKEDLGDRYSVMLDALRQQYLDDEFSMASPLGQKASKTISGGSKLISLVLGLSDEDAFSLMTEMPVECKDLLATLDASSFSPKKEDKKEDDGDPKQEPPAPVG